MVCREEGARVEAKRFMYEWGVRNEGKVEDSRHSWGARSDRRCVIDLIKSKSKPKARTSSRHHVRGRVAVGGTPKKEAWH